MVGRKHENAVPHGTAKLCAVFVVPKRRRHFVVRVITWNLLTRKKKMVRCCLGSDGEPFFLCIANKRNALGRGNVLNVETASCHAANREVATNCDSLRRDGDDREMPDSRKLAITDHAILDFLRIHRVFADAHAKRSSAAHRLFHHLVVGDIRAVIGEERSARLGKRFKIGDFVPKPPFGDAGRGEKEWGSGGVGE